MASETLHFDFDRHRIAYRVMGRGPALVVLSLYRRRENMVQVRLLRDRWQVFQIAPLGYGSSERTAEALESAIVPTVANWMTRRLQPSWVTRPRGR